MFLARGTYFRQKQCPPLERRLHLEQHALRVLEAFLDAHQELHRFAAVDQAVIVAQGEVHHGADHDLIVHDDGPFLNAVHPQNRGLRRVENRRAEHRAEDAAVGDGEGSAHHVGGCDLAFAGLLRDDADFLFDFGETELVYTDPTTRLTGHLQGYDPTQAPTFVWPERLKKVKEEIRAKAKERSEEGK